MNIHVPNKTVGLLIYVIVLQGLLILIFLLPNSSIKKKKNNF